MTVRPMALRLAAVAFVVGFLLGVVVPKLFAADLGTQAQDGPSVVVAPGQTLWGIASKSAPGSDPRELVDEIQALNHLDGAHVYPGQRLLLPQ